MSFAAQVETGNIILWTHSDSWPSAVRRLNLPCKLIHALGADDLLSEAKMNTGSLGLIELSPAKLVETCRWAALASNNPYQLRLLALGTPELVRWSPLVHSSGFAEAYWSTIEAPRLLPLVKLHLSTVRWPQVTLEEKIEAGLPWPPSQKKCNRNP